MWSFYFRSEDGIRDLVLSHGLGGVYRRQAEVETAARPVLAVPEMEGEGEGGIYYPCLLYTTDAADDLTRLDHA